MRCHRRLRKHLQVQELFCAGVLRFHFAQCFALQALGAQRRHARVDLSRLRAGDAQLLRDGAEIDDFNNGWRVGALLKHRLCWTAPRLDACFGTDFDNKQCLSIERLPQTIHVDRPREQQWSVIKRDVSTRVIQNIKAL